MANTHRRIRLLSGVTCLAFAAACGGGGSDETGVESGNAANGRPVEVSGGVVSGTVSDLDPAVAVYRGIPYAAPPTRQLRWRPPEAAEPSRGRGLEPPTATPQGAPRSFVGLTATSALVPTRSMRIAFILTCGPPPTMRRLVSR